MNEWGQSVLSICKNLGVPYAGIFDWDHPETQKQYQQAIQKYESWLAHQYHATMDYLVRGLPRRKDPREVFPGLQSVLVVAIPYETQLKTQFPKLSRYLQGRDYHQVIRGILQKVISQVEPIEEARICIDTSAVMERTLGAMAGLGWIGKNAMLIHPKLGSYFFLGVVFLSQRSGCGPNLLPNYCGNCVRCLTGCPTDAFPSAGVLDSRKCISAFTLENRGLEDELELHGWIAGCDLCQEVCPFNFKPFRDSWVGSTRSEYQNWSLEGWRDLTKEKFQELIHDSALERVRFQQMQRNVRLVLKQQSQKV